MKVVISVDNEQRSARIDFSGSSAQLNSNYNAPRAVTMAAVLYVFRCLVDADIPLNEGCLAPMDIIVPEGSMLNPRYPAAVVSGNVETSQLITDALLGALSVAGASQGSANNFTFGNARYQYYETIAGGEPGGIGRNAVERSDGRIEELAGGAQTKMKPGDVFIIETPGGGGYGTPP